jgi:two-component system OmpR family sensor kinase
MKMKIFSSVKTRLSLWFVGTLALIIIIFSLALYLSLANSLEKGIDSALENAARKRYSDILESVEETGIAKINAEDIMDIEELDEVKTIFSLVYAQLLEQSSDGPGKNMIIMARSENLKDNMLPLPHPGKEKDIKTSFKNFTDQRLSESQLRLINFPFRLDEETSYILQFAATRKEVDSTLKTLLMIILIIDPILLIFSFFGGYFLVNRTLSPVKNVVSSAKKITVNDLSHRIPAAGSKDEIGELVDTLNDMIARLDRSFQKITQFSTDVSHEFRSPLTIIRGEIDVALRKKRFEKDYIKTLESIQEEVITLQRIVDNLLFLGETEAENSDFPFYKVAMDKIVLDVFEETQKTADKKNIRFVLKEVPGIDIEGVAVLLKRAFFNLFENAVKYTGEGGKVEILLEKDSHYAVFSIKDTGIGIAENEIPYIFDRFYRVDKARCKRIGSGGLGLSIVKRIIQLHNGKIEVKSTPGQGSTFIVHLPLNH